MNAVATVTHLLTMPDAALDGPGAIADHAWARLTAGHALLDAIRLALPSCSDADFGRWFRHLDRWVEGGVASLDQDQWWTARHLLWCAHYARKHAGVDPGVFGLSNEYAELCVPPARRTEDGLRLAEASARACVAWFGSVQEPRRATVPVASYDETTQTGKLAVLEVEILDGTGHYVARHPEDAFLGSGDGSFAKSMVDAFGGARRLHQDGGSNALWRVRRYDANGESRGSSSIPVPDGRSASGAAAFAFWHALHQPCRVPDAGVIVLAQVSGSDPEHCELDGVERIPEKTRAVIRANREIEKPLERFDTIVVATAGNKAEAENVLREEQGGDRTIRVVIP